MARIRWSRTNYVDVASLTASFETADNPAENVKTPQIAQVWRADDQGTLDINFGTPVSLDVLAFAQPNDGVLIVDATGGTQTVRWTAGSTAGASDIYDSGAIQNGDIMETRKGLHVHAPAASVTTQHLRLTFTLSQITEPLSIGRVWAGPEYVFQRAMAGDGFARRWVEGATPVNLGETTLVPFGALGSFARRYRITWPALSEADADEMLDGLQRNAGASGQILLSPWPDARNRHSILARPVESADLDSILFPELQAHRATFQEWR